MKKSPNPIDRHVGSRVRMRRMLIGMSQEKLGEALGITFQQVQKYEKGTNRISASRLQHIAAILGVTVGFFYEGAPKSEGGAFAPEGLAEEGSPAYMADFVSSAEGLELMKSFQRIRDAKVRRRVVDLVSAIAAGEGEDRSV
jgi:transcriptional regulator with XRE-family HTH domain